MTGWKSKFGLEQWKHRASQRADFANTQKAGKRLFDSYGGPEKSKWVKLDQ